MSSATDEFPECPLCMEIFEPDDLNFFPCTCGYQICRFCWHRLRTDENGLCPACRKSYPEDPAQFKPLTDDEVHKIKKDRRQKETQRKQKSAECRKHLANVRVVQKNLVFVVGLAPRLTDPEVLKRHEYFGRFGKIHKVVINQSTSYVGSQGPSASAYVTYIRPEDALTAIRFVNNAQVDGRTIKASLGTTKYCSHFLKGTQCMKPDCMYLHDMGDEAASFTKEEIQQGKHVQYEQKLSEQYLSSTHTSNEMGAKAQTKPKESSPPSSRQLSPTANSLQESDSANSSSASQSAQQPVSATSLMPNGGIKVAVSLLSGAAATTTCTTTAPATTSSSLVAPSLPQNNGQVGGVRPLPYSVSPSDHLSLFSDSGFLSDPNFKPVEPPVTSQPDEHLPPKTDVPEINAASFSNDWQEGFGFTSNNTDTQDDDLGFDPYVVSAKGLADMIEKEKASNTVQSSQMPAQLPNNITRLAPNSHMLAHVLQSKSSPGFAALSNGYVQHPANPNNIVQPQSSKMMNFMQLSPGVNPPPSAALPLHLPLHLRHLYGSEQLVFGPVTRKHDNTALYRPLQSCITSHQQPNSVFNLQEWQDGLKALLPNINISFGTQSLASQREFGSGVPVAPGLNPRPIMPIHSQGYRSLAEKGWYSSSSLASHSMPDLSWDPAIINTGAITDANLSDEPHWMASLHHLTDDHSTTTPLMHPSHSMSWLQPPSVSRFPPPGFANTTSRQISDQQNLTEHKLPAL